MTVYPKIGVAKRVKRILFAVEGLPPLTVEIPLEEYSPEKEKEAIRKAIEKYLSRQPEEIEV